MLDCRIEHDKFRAFRSTVPTYVAHPGDDLNAIEWRITRPSAIQIVGIIFISKMESRSAAARLRANKLDLKDDGFD